MSMTYLFNTATREALELARRSAADRRHEYVGTEHILFGLLASKDAGLDAVVSRLGLDRVKVADRLDSVIERGKGKGPSPTDLPYTSRAKRVLELALESVRDAGKTDAGPEHLLVGLCAEERGIAAQVLGEAGVTADSVRKALAE